MADSPPLEWSHWTETPPGRYVLGWEQKQMDRLVVDMFGYHAVQLGLPQLDALRENRMTSRTLVLDRPLAGAPASGADSTVRGDFLALPLATQSVDLLVLPHTLEMSAEPHELLREAERVLLPEGRLVIAGFNSLSLWGVRHSLAKVRGRAFLPAQQNTIAFLRIKDWLKLLGFELNRGRFGCYRPPFASEHWLARHAFMEPAGDRWWPIFGAMYIVTAIKRERGMRLVGPAWKKRVTPAPALAPAATGRAHDER